MEKANNKNFLSWDEAFQAGMETAGGKGWNLGRLSTYGFPVPPGGVLTAAAYGEFIEDNGLRSELEEISKEVTIDNLGEKESEQRLDSLREKITNGTIPTALRNEIIDVLENTGLIQNPMAVRSSASSEDSSRASFAGIYESFLNVRGPENILAAIKGCYASLWTPRAVSYRRKMNIADNEVVPAVIIMEMVEAKAAGIGFTCDPRTGREDMLTISANYGLGESVVGGLVDPDEYSLHSLSVMPRINKKKTGRKEGIAIPVENGGTLFLKAGDSGYGSPGYGRQADQVLSDGDIVKLGRLMLRVFDSLGKGHEHQDIEWVFNGNEFFLVQARPVTALPRYTYPALKGQPDIWSNANFRDAFPMVQSTLFWGITRIVTQKMIGAT
ncbi:MAG: PEP/pyruvate-binding domain-containing protein, partial [Desulfocucumaceae bacterium]